MQKDFATRIGPDPTSDSSWGVRGFENNYFLSYNIGHPEWTNKSGISKQKIASHQYAHIWQVEQGCLSPQILALEESPPRWFITGMAEYLALEANVKDGLVSRTGLDLTYQTVAKRPNNLALGALETNLPDDLDYEYLALATRYLLNGKQLSSLKTYCNLIGKDGRTWSDAFAQTFGESPQSFYARFEAYRQSL